MEAKDSIANLASFGALGSVLMQWQAGLTIVLLISAIILNIVRIRITLNKSNDTKKEE
tara:strand:- start:507 stop:680 length:174 start_codon:yes stop_codon:yes gene_type:complete